MEFRPWMIEAASGFVKASRLLWENNKSTPAMVNAAIGLEILFKSFNAVAVGHQGGIGEQYHVDKPGHNLLVLFDAIPEQTRDQLALQTYRRYFEERVGDLFVLGRYPYERGAFGGGTNAFIEVAEEMLERVIRAYKKGGCTDPWIVAFQTKD